ncbi:33206_t:CDS:2, partial [Gigaspora margarita]
DDFIKKITYFTKSLTAKHVQFLAVSIEYPPTNPKGYAVVYNFIESNNYSATDNDQIQKAMKDKTQTVFCDIQYSQEGKGGASYVNCSFFEGPDNEQIQIMKDQRTFDFNSNIFQLIKSNEELRSIQTNTLAVGKYTHLPPLPNHIPEVIKDQLNIMINNISNTLSEIHALLNNLDRLHYLVGRVQQSQNPYGQGIL